MNKYLMACARLLTTPKTAMAGAFAASVLGAVPSAHAAVITYVGTGVNSANAAEALSASAQFTTSAGQIQLVLTNTLSPTLLRSAGQALSDITFTLSNSAGTKGAATAAGQLGDVTVPPGTVTYVSGTPDRWITGTHYTISGSNVALIVLGGGQPDEMILPFVSNGGIYPIANSSVDNFNPSTIGPATFTLALSGVTATTTVTSAVFSFGTGPETFVTGTPSTPPVPEPASLALFGTALIGFGLLRRRRA